MAYVDRQRCVIITIVGCLKGLLQLCWSFEENETCVGTPSRHDALGMTEQSMTELYMVLKIRARCCNTQTSGVAGYVSILESQMRLRFRE